MLTSSKGNVLTQESWSSNIIVSRLQDRHFRLSSGDTGRGRSPRSRSPRKPVSLSIPPKESMADVFEHVLEGWHGGEDTASPRRKSKMESNEIPETPKKPRSCFSLDHLVMPSPRKSRPVIPSQFYAPSLTGSSSSTIKSPQKSSRGATSASRPEFHFTTERCTRSLWLIFFAKEITEKILQWNHE
jgi:hypothetical protein